MRSLVSLQAIEGMAGDVAAADGVAKHAAERREDPLDRPRRKTLRLQLTGEGDDIVSRDQRNPTPSKRRKQVQPQLRAVEVERALASRSDRHLDFELGQPPSGDLGEGDSRRQGKSVECAQRTQELALFPRLLEADRLDGSKARAPGDHHTDRVLAVCLPIDPALDAHACAIDAARHGGSSVFVDSVREECRARCRAQLLASGNGGKLNSA
jgi:hypothetical protein